MLPQHPQQKKKGIKIDSKFLKKKKLSCGNCKHFEVIETEYSENVGMCNAFGFQNGDRITARGARSDNKWCGMRGVRFEPKQDEPKLIEEMTLEELNEIHTDGLSPQDKRRITNAKKKLEGK